MPLNAHHLNAYAFKLDICEIDPEVSLRGIMEEIV